MGCARGWIYYIAQRYSLSDRYEKGGFEKLDDNKLIELWGCVIMELKRLMRDTFLRWQFSEEYREYQPFLASP